MKAWDRNERFVAVIAGAQSGKTSWGPWWLWREIQRCGSGDYLAVTASYDLFKLKMLPVLRETFENILGVGRYRASDRIIELANPETGNYDLEPWGRIILRSAVSGGGLESATAKAAWCDEAGQDEVTVETWEAVLRRLALYQGRVLITTTPYNLGWLKTEIWDRWQRGESDYAVVNFASTLNPLYPKAEYERAKATMPAWRFRMFVEGVFDRPAGMIYECFDPAWHVVDDFTIPADWSRFVGMDFGGVNHALVWLARHPETGAAYVYREEMQPGLTTHQRALDAKQYLSHEKVIHWAGGAKSEDQFRRDWRQEGVFVQEPQIADVESGINAVTEALKTDNLFIFRSCTGLRDQFGSYRRKLDDRGQPTIEIVNKREFHYLDALRYIVPAITKRSAPKLAFVSW